MSARKSLRLLRKLGRALLLAFAALVIVLAIGVGGFRLLVTQLPGYQDELQAWVSDALGLTLRFDAVDARWGLAGPQLTLHGVSLGTGGAEVMLDAEEVDVGLSAVRFVFERTIAVDRLTISGTHFTVIHAADGSLRLRGVTAADQAGFSIDDLPAVRVLLRDSELSYVDEASGASWQLQAVQAELGREGESLTLAARAQAPSQLASRIEISGEASIASGERVLRDWQARLALRDVSLPTLLPLFGNVPVVARQGHGDVSIWIDVSDGQPLRGTLEASIEDLGLTARAADGAVSSYDHVQVTGEWQRKERGWQLVLSNLDVTRNGVAWARGGNLNIELTRGDTAGDRLAVSSAYLRLEDVTPALALLPKSAFTDEWTALAPRGELMNAELDATRTDNEWTYSLAGQFSRLGFAAHERWPGFSGLSGELRADTVSGRLSLTSQGATMLWPTMLESPVDIEQLEGTVVWRRGRNGFRLVSDNLVVANNDAATRSNLELTLPLDGSSPRLELETNVSGFEAVAVKRYLPINALPPSVVSWVRQAVRGGWVSQARVTLFGPLWSFPFDHGEGQFRATAEVENGTLSYLDGWPLGEGLTGSVEFVNAAFRGRGRGRVLRNESNNVQVEVPDVRAAVFNLRATSFGPLHDVLAYLQQAPLLAEHLGPYFSRLSAENGRGEVTLDLTLPLHEMTAFDLTGALRIVDGELALAGFAPHATEVQGVLNLHNGLVSGEGIEAILLRGPVLARVSPATQTGYRSQLDFQGEVAADALLAALGVPTGGLVAGQTQWQGTMLIPATESTTRAPVTVGLSSNLSGVALRFPQPLAKAPAEPMNFQLDMSFGDADHMALVGHLGATRRFALTFGAADDGLAFERGEIKFGGAFPEQPAQDGLRISGQVPELKLEEWLRLASSAQPRQPINTVLLGGDLQVAEFFAFGQQLGNTELDLARAEDRWEARIDSEAVGGTLVIPFDLHDRPQVLANMDRLYLALGNQEEAAGEDPRSLPGLKLEARDFAIGGRRLGRLSADIQADPLGLRLVSFGSVSESFHVEGSGGWFATAAGPTTRLAFTLTSDALATTLAQLGFDPVAEGQHAEVTASVHWPSGPSGDWMAHLAGDVALRVEHGSMLDLEPGAGRVMGLMSITALPRRLALDFRDVFNRGLVFDAVAGDFVIVDGDAYTNNLKLTGPVAEIGVVGRTGLRDHDYQQQAVVTAEPGKMLPTVGGLIGGPGVGAALLIFTRIFKESLKGIGRASYCVTGSWDEPTVERLSAEELANGKLCAALPPAAAMESTSSTADP